MVRSGFLARAAARLASYLPGVFLAFSLPRLAGFAAAFGRGRAFAFTGLAAAGLAAFSAAFFSALAAFFSALAASALAFAASLEGAACFALAGLSAVAAAGFLAGAFAFLSGASSFLAITYASLLASPSRRPRMSLTLRPRRAATERGLTEADSAAKAAFTMLCGLEVPTDFATTSCTPSASNTARIGPPAMMPV